MDRARRLDSALIDRIGFDDEQQVLTVWFRRSGRYLYHGVPRALYDALAGAASAGRFFNDHIRGRFPCRSERRRYPLED